jgi:hypothetical protein
MPAEGHVLAASTCGGKDLRCYVEVDRPWLPAWPLYDLDGHPALPRCLQHKLGDGGSVAIDLPVEAGPPTTAEEDDPLPTLCGLHGLI